MSDEINDTLILSGMTPAEISAALGLKPFQGRQIFKWIHQKRVFDFNAMTDLSLAIRETLSKRCAAVNLALANMSSSSRGAGTKKALLRLPDGETVESVLIRDRDRVTLCLSSQVGCAVKCTFCATGESGYTRNLSAAEIVEQALYLLADEDLEGRTPNIVYMGMGEPFRNYDAVVASIRLLMTKDGLGIGARKITVSTVGDVPGIERFTEEDWQVRLSISLHAANDPLRTELIPLNKKYPLPKLLKAVRAYELSTGRNITFEWTLLKGVNDQPIHATELAEIIGAMNAHVNLIPYNPVAGLGYAPPPRKVCEQFRDRLADRGVSTTLRKECGQDIDAACGQLRRRHLTEA
jgi:23S rRNA (adenine2503-C2)-methyltransferase